MSGTNLEARTSEARKASTVSDRKISHAPAHFGYVQEREQPSGLGLRPGSAPTSEARQPVPALIARQPVPPVAEKDFYQNKRGTAALVEAQQVLLAGQPLPVVASAVIFEYVEPRRLNRSNFSPRGLQFFSSCPA